MEDKAHKKSKSLSETSNSSYAVKNIYQYPWEGTEELS